ncbi:glycoside hydrolase family 43 protein [Paenibacillus hexagrammi]|uniref:Glycoside hydrolase family 43 protein n=1 Tax=Paenibacillus hexagrammi TaxID=2908839 RepID=A0ABY3SJL3_9BACL|nr:glycoside hydrolase family 43 protein [Paenibacillus sp. YPD9-1]UJF33429.1 glycoside hydrolase family 43 protein [Paenibacillus sp. YPD9-1]
MVANKDLQIRDPFVFPVPSEGKYYLFGSTDANIWGKGTGFNVYVGTDLKEWEGPFPAFRPDENFFSDENFWAPEVHEHQGRYYMFATFRRKDNARLGTAILVSDSLLGPFVPHSDGPLTPEAWNSLDGTLFIDEEQQPWMVFCHEWKDISDGEVCAVRLTEDFKGTIGEPVTLFQASTAPWATHIVSDKIKTNDKYVTDGPYVYKAGNGELLILWASFIERSYAQGVARSASGSILGPWVHEDKALFVSDGGHDMLFRTFDGRLMLTIHTPNKTPNERPIFLEVTEQDGKLEVVGS